MFIIYETDKFSFFWKPHGLPSTFGKEKSFLYHLEEGNLEFDTSDYQSIQKYIDSSLQQVQNTKSAITHQTQTFSKDQEYWLLNRLDNDTAGFLYFAKDLSTFDQYRQLQAQNCSEKHYIAQVQGNITESSLRAASRHPRRFGVWKQTISFPIMHRSLEKMIAIKDPKDLKKGRWKEHTIQTFVELLNYDKKSDISTLLVKIHKWIRHQIRVHLASIGFPIVGDSLYGENKDNEHLHLRSVGFNIVK